MEFPRTVYKEGGDLSWSNNKLRDVRYSELIVKDEKEFSLAKNKGYVDSFSDVINGITKKATRKAVPKKEEVDGF